MAAGGVATTTGGGVARDGAVDGGGTEFGVVVGEAAGACAFVRASRRLRQAIIVNHKSEAICVWGNCLAEFKCL